jgi:subtilisin family serine protease
MMSVSGVTAAALLTLAGVAVCPVLGDAGFVPGQVIVRPRAGVTIETINNRYGSATLREILGRRWFLLAPPPMVSEDAFRQTLLLDGDVEVTELNFLADDTDAGGGTQSIFLPRAMAQFESDPTISIIGVPGVQSISRGSGVLVGVVDSGIDATHPRLAGRVASGGYNFIGLNADTRDLADGVDNNGDGRVDEMAGHGTFVAGLISRVAPDAMLLPVRVLDSDGGSSAFLVAQGVYHAIDAGASVVNVSIGSATATALLASVAADAEAAGVVLVASAGNDGSSSPAREPASLRALGTVGVAATTAGDVRADFSNYGSWVSLSAPGVGVISLLPGSSYGEASGTSFAAPLVSGVAALVRASCPAASVDQVREHIASTARPLGGLNPSYVGQLGAGRVDAGAAFGVTGGEGPACWSDTDFNGTIGFLDITVVLANFGNVYGPAANGPGDATRDGAVTFLDITRVLSAFGAF